jgi:hypothetical protein
LLVNSLQAFIAIIQAFFIIVTSASLEALDTIYLALIFSVISFVNIISLVGIVATEVSLEAFIAL